MLLIFKEILVGVVLMLVRVLFSDAKDTIMIIALDPLTANLYTLKVIEDVSHLPIGEEVSQLYDPYRAYEEIILKSLEPSRRYLCTPDSFSRVLYNPWDLPNEDRAITDMLSRLHLLRGADCSSQLVIGEDPKFVGQLKSLLECTSLPCFSTVNELTLSFQTDAASLESHALKNKISVPSSLKQLVFGSIRANRPLLTFLSNVVSPLRVVLASYDSGVRISINWTGFLAHLTNYRNPFLSVQLLPRFLEPENYIYKPKGW
jgi:hypothetical protein